MNTLRDTPVRPGEDPVQGEGLIPQEQQGLESPIPPTGRSEDRGEDFGSEGIPTQGREISDALAGLRARGEQAQEDALIGIRTGLSDALGATVQQWDTKLLLDKASSWFTPSEPDPEFSLTGSIQSLKTPLSKEEREWLYKKAPQNKDDFDTLVQTLEDQRELAKLTQHYPKSSAALMFIDPVYIAGGGLVGSAARALRMGRLIQGLSVGAGEVGLVYAAGSQRPIDDAEVWLAALLGTGFGMAMKPLPKALGSDPSPRPVTGTDLVQKERESLYRHLNDISDLVPVQKMHYENTHIGQFDTIPAGRVIYDTRKGVRDIQEIRREFEAIYGPRSNARGEFRDSSETPHYYLRITDPRDIPARRNVQHGLEVIVKDTRFPEVTRATAQYLLNAAQGALRHVRMEFGARLPDRWAGAYSRPDHVVRIKAPTKNFREADAAMANTITHEATHAITAIKMDVGKMHVRRGIDSAHARLYKELMSLFNQARRVAQKQGLDAVDPKTGKDVTPWAVRYAFHNEYEFFAQMLSGKPEVWKYLDDLDRTKIPDLASTNRPLSGVFFDAIRRLHGMDLEEATVLARGLGIMESIIQTPLDIKYRYTDGTAVREIVHGSMEPPTREKIIKETTQDVDAMASVGMEAVAATAKDPWTKRLGKAISWNLYKTAEAIDPEFARTWLSDPLRSNAGDNITSTRRAVRADFMDYQVKYYEAVREYMSEQGIRPIHYITKFREVRKIQRQMEHDLRNKLAEWDHLSNQGRDIPVENTALYRVAEAYDATMQHAAKVGVKDGVLPSEILGRRGYFRRRFDGAKIAQLENRLASAFGGGEEGVAKARAALADALMHTFRGMDDIPEKSRRIYAKALLDRARRQDELQDLRFRGHMGLEIIAATRDMLERSGVSQREIRRVTELLEGRIKDAGRASYQKGRIDLDMSATLALPNGESIRVSELLDGNLTHGLQNYLDDLSGRVAMARHGIPDTAALDKARQAFVAKAPTMLERQKAQDLFDNIVNSTLGRPVGEIMPTVLRYVQAFTQMINLRNSGFWQVTEFAPMMMRYGSLVGIPRMVREVFGSFTGMTKFFDQPENANHLGAILSRNTWNDLRWRPFIEKMDDGHSINMDSALGGAIYAQQYVYVVNGMRYLMRRQSVAAANLLLHSLEQAAVRGDVKLTEFFARYNIDQPKLDAIREEFNKHGWYVDKWNSETFNSIQPQLMTIIDEDVLRARLGEVPALAQFSQVGRVLSTFRSFIMTSHNKVLAGNLSNDGAKAMGILFAYQSMLSAMMVQVASVSGGRGVIEDPEDWATRAVSMMGGIGLFAEGWNIITGNSTQFGNPFMGSVDRAIGVAGNLASGEIGKAIHGTVNALPLISLIPGVGIATSLAFE